MDDFSDYDVRLIPALRAQIEAITTARDEAAVAYAERVRVLREALELVRDDECGCLGCSAARAALEATK